MLDTRTLTLMLLLTSSVLAVVMTLVSLNQRQYPGPRYWALGSWLITAGVFLFLFREQTSLFPTILLSNSLFFVSFAMMGHGLRRFLGLPPTHRFYAAACSAGIIAMSLFIYWRDDTAMRVVVFGLVSSVVIMHGALSVLRNVPLGGAWAYRFAGGAFAVAGLYQLLRAAVIPWLGHPDSYFAPSPFTAINAIVMTLTYLCLAVGLVMMLSARLSVDLNAHMADLRDEINIRRQAEERLAREATLDPLTGAANRRKLFEEASRAQAQSRRHGRPLAVIMLDIDYFKQVNDQYGHEVGDEVLRRLTAHCQGQLRQGDTFARYGGEEFVIILPENDATRAFFLAQRLRVSLAGLRVPTPQGPVSFTCSFGVADLSPQDQGIEELLRRADQALYLAKNQGRDRVVSWRAEDFTPPALAWGGQ